MLPKLTKFFFYNSNDIFPQVGRDGGTVGKSDVEEPRNAETRSVNNYFNNN